MNAASELLSLTYKQGATVIGDLTYTYDAAGNRIKTGGSFARSGLPSAITTTSYNANNQQTTFGANSLTYDFNGNLQTVTDAGGTATYSWNARNQLAGISATGFAASFAYDSFGRRTGKTIQGATTNFVYDGLNPVQEKNGGTVTANLLTGLGIDEFITRTDGAGTRGLLTDALGSTVALGDGSGTLQTQYTYEPFGYVSQTGSANTNSYKYTGREDDGSGLYYYRARYYHPRLQRFISEDPMGFGGGANFYAYVRNAPGNWNDALGLFPGQYPPPPPGYDPNTWTSGKLPGNGQDRDYVQDQKGTKWIAHPEDDIHWRHWDKQGPTGKDEGRWPDNPFKPIANKKKRYKCDTDPNGDAPAWQPPGQAPAPDDEIPDYAKPFVWIPQIGGPILPGSSVGAMNPSMPGRVPMGPLRPLLVY